MGTNKVKECIINSPDEDTWNKHKDLLRCLYFDSTLSKLMDHMKQHFNFTASKNQYERKFKEWKLRKNLSSDEWEFVLGKKRKRDEDNKETKVTLHGLEISKKRLKKEESRYTLSKLIRIFSSYPTAPTPEGLTISTPPPEALIGFFLKNIRIDNIPGFCLADIFAAKGHPQSSFNANANVSLSLNSSHDSAPALSREILDLLLANSEHGSARSSTKAHKRMVQQLRSLSIEQYDGEAEDRVASLFGPSKVEALQEFMTIVAQFGSNNQLNPDQELATVDWVAEQTECFLENLLRLHNPCVEALLEHLLEQCASGGYNARAAQLLLLADNDRNLHRGRRENSLSLAIQFNLLDEVKALLNEGIDVNAAVLKYMDGYDSSFSWTMLGVACKVTSNVDMVKILIDGGADVNAPVHEDIDNGSAVYDVARFGSPDILRLLLKSGGQFDISKANAKSDGRSILACAMKFTGVEMVKELLALGAECVDHLQEFHDGNRTELQEACYTGDIEMVKVLLETPSGKNVLRSGQYSWAPLRDAAMEGHFEIVEILVEAGADINATSRDQKESTVKNKARKLVKGLIPSTALMAAVETGNVEMVLTVLGHGAKVDAPAIGNYGVNVLAVAENLRYHEIARILREHGGKPGREFLGLITDIQFAAARKDMTKVEESLCLGGHVTHILDTGEQALKKAGGTMEDVLSTYLQVCGHEIDSKSPESGLCALEIAIDLGSVALIQKIGKAGANFNDKTSHGLSFLQWAMKKLDYISRERNGSRFEVIDGLLWYGARPDSPGILTEIFGWVGTPVEIAAQSHDHRTLESLILAAKSHVICEGLSGLLRRAMLNCKLGLDSIQLLLDHGASVDARVGNPSEMVLQLAVSYKSTDVVELLLDNGADANANASSLYCCARETALQAAACRGNIDMVTLLIDKGADISTPATGGRDSRTALQTAAYWGHIEVMKLLLENGANINDSPGSNYGRTALQAAITGWGSDEVTIQMLIDSGADIHAPAAMKGGVTALQAAAIKGYLKIALKLLRMGADPNAPGSAEEGRTALEGAAEHGRLDMVQLLFNAGAEPTQSAVNFAEQERHFVIADMIKAALREKEANEQDNSKSRGKGKEVER